MILLEEQNGFREIGRHRNFSDEIFFVGLRAGRAFDYRWRGEDDVLCAQCFGELRSGNSLWEPLTEINSIVR